MPDDAPARCREWLGIDPADVDTPHRLLGLDADETDPVAIVRAADRRIATLRVIPPDRGGERDALITRVAAARDRLLTGVGGGRSAPPAVLGAFPSFPPVPRTSATEDHGMSAEPTVKIDPRRTGSRRRSNGSVGGLVFSLLAVAVTGVAAYLAWPHLQRALTATPKKPRAARTVTVFVEPKAEDRADAEPDSPSGRESERRRRLNSKPVVRAAADPESDADSKPAAVAAPGKPSDATASAEPAAPPPAEPEPPVIDVEQIRARVDDAITKAYAALRKHDFKGAGRTLEAVLDLALDDQQATDRLYRWRLFLEYAKDYSVYREKALTSAAAKAATYDLGERQIGVVELTKDLFIYRDSEHPGRNQRVPRNEIPPDVEAVVVGAGFHRGGRAANFVLFGAGALARGEPDPDAARRAWTTASERGSEDGAADGTLLLELLDDPAVRDAPAAQSEPAKRSRRVRQ